MAEAIVECLPGAAVSNVQGDSLLAAAGRTLARPAIERLRQIDTGDLPAVSQKGIGDGPTEAAGSAGDDGGARKHHAG
jgi:hypothetical protein